MQDLRIIYYHHISPDPKNDLHAVSLSTFKRQIAFLKHQYEIISLNKAIQLNQSGLSLKGKLCITFDDGFASFYHHALPVLSQYKLPACVFLISNCVNNQSIMWRTKLELIIKHRTHLVKDAVQALCQNYQLETPCQNLMQWSLNWLMNQKEYFSTFLWEYTKMPDMEEYLSQNPLYLNTKQIHEAMESDIDFGSHTRTHPICSKLSYEDLCVEIEGSASELSALLKKRISLFSYPFGLRAQPDVEAKLVNNQQIDSLLGIYYKKYHPNDPFHWERDNMEIPFVKSILRFTPLFDLYQKSFL